MKIEDILSPITVADVKEAYNFSIQCPQDPLVQSLGLESEFLAIGERAGPPPFVQYNYNVLKSDKSNLLDKPHPQRRLCLDEKLFNKTVGQLVRTGKVAQNFWLFIKKQYRKKGIGSLIYKLEEKLYRKWGAIQVQLTATSEGKAVWRRKGFILPGNELLTLETRYEQWCKDMRITYAQVLDIMLYPEEFLLSDAVNQFSMFKELN